MNRFVKYTIAAGVGLMLTGCNIYKKYEMPTADSAIVADYAKASEAAADSASLPSDGNRSLPTRSSRTSSALRSTTTRILRMHVSM